MFQKCLQFELDETVWQAKQRILGSFAKVGTKLLSWYWTLWYFNVDIMDILIYIHHIQNVFDHHFTILKIVPYLLISLYLVSNLYVCCVKKFQYQIKPRSLIFSFLIGSKRCSQLWSVLSTNEWEGREISGWGAAAERVPLTGTHRIPGGNATAFISLGSSRFLTKKKLDWKRGGGVNVDDQGMIVCYHLLYACRIRKREGGFASQLPN